MQNAIVTDIVGQQIYSSLDQHYVEILEKTNQQLNSSISAFAVSFGVLGVIIGLIGIGTAFLIYRLQTDYKKELKKTAKELEEELLKRQGIMFEDLKIQYVAAQTSFINSGIKTNKSKFLLIPGSIVKGETLDFWYWYGNDTNRYSFLSHDVVESWFPDAATRPAITAVRDTVLASITLNGFIGYKPGTRLIKISSDPKIYAISEGMKLRWLENEKIIEQIYGSSWRDLLITVPDVVFIEYVVGDSVVRVSDYNFKDEMNNAQLP